jgi:hypothetical protein
MTTVEQPVGIPDGYKHLFEIGDRVVKNKNQEIEYIILQVCSEDRKLQMEIRVYSYKARTHAQEEQLLQTIAKVEVLLRKKGLILQGIEVAFEIGSAFGGGTVTKVGMGLHALAQGMSHSAGHLEKKNNSEITLIDYHSQRLRDLASERTQQMQAADREFEQQTSLIDRIMQMIQREFELIASQNG